MSISIAKTMNSLSFGKGFVTLSEKNLGKQINQNIVQPFNENSVPQFLMGNKTEIRDILNDLNVKSTDTISKPKDLNEKVNLFILAAGSGSRFKKLAKTVGNYNKISLPLPVKDGKHFQMLDVPMAQGRYFLGKEGYTPIIADKKSGSMGDIVKQYLAGKEIKDTIVCCGDNVFGTNAKELTKFFIKAINDKNINVALVGVERTPEVVAERFGVLAVKPCSGESKDVMKLTGFEEKPSLELAKKLATKDGKNIANTGMFYISKEAMTNLINEIKSGNNNISKDKDEPYDFALATQYIHQKMPDWFGLQPDEGSKVKIVKKWEDVGEPAAYYRFLGDAEKGNYLNNFPEVQAHDIQNAIKNRTDFKSKTPAILFSTKYSSLKEVPKDKIKDSKDIEGMKIVTDKQD